MQVKCKRCGDPFMARVADRNRGWGKFCSKSCKAVAQEQRTGQYRRFLELRDMAAQGLCFPDMSSEGDRGVGDFPRD